MTFNEMVGQGRVRDSNRIATQHERCGRATSAGGKATRARRSSLGGLEDYAPDEIPYVDMSAPDRGYNEWLNRVWMPALHGVRRTVVAAEAKGVEWGGFLRKNSTAGAAMGRYAQMMNEA